MIASHRKEMTFLAVAYYIGAVAFSLFCSFDAHLIRSLRCHATYIYMYAINFLQRSKLYYIYSMSDVLTAFTDQMNKIKVRSGRFL